MSLLFITLKKEICTTVRISEDVRMSRLSLIPLALCTIGKERLIPHTLPMHAILTYSHTNLLRRVIICTSIEHNKTLASSNNRCRLDTLHLSLKLRL